MAKKKKTSLQRVRVGYSRAWKRPTVKLVHLVVFAAVFMWLGHYLFPSNALTYPYVNNTAASNDRSKINNFRAGKGWSTLSNPSCLNTIASNYAKKEAAANAISDPPSTWFNNQFNTYCSGHYWLSWGANDGMGPGDPSIFDAFLASCEHRRNIADHGAAGTSINIGPCTDRYGKQYGGSYPNYPTKSAAYNRVGTGAWEGSSGRLFVSEIFVRW